MASSDGFEAVALLDDCLPPDRRRSLPAAELAAACRGIRAEYGTGHALWSMVGSATGWGATLPDDDEDLWLGVAMCVVSPKGPPSLDADLVRCLAAVEPDDWLATVIELTRAGAGTAVDPDSLLLLSARCMDVDSGAVDPQGAAIMSLAFEVLLPLWRAVGALDARGTLTEVGEWGLAPALARAWGG